MYDPRYIANQFIEPAAENDTPLTHLQIQKLVYFAHGWSLALNNTALVRQQFLAWRFGPVSRPIYDSLSKYRGNPIYRPISPVDETSLNSPSKHVITETYRLYGALSGMELTRLTHAHGGPWHQMRLEGREVIPDLVIKKHFKRVLDDWQ